MIEPKPELKKVKIYETALFPEKWDMKLDSNENYIGPSKNVLEKIRNVSLTDISHYPYYGELIEKIAYKFDIKKSSIVLTNGADEALSAVFMTYARPEDSVLSVYPSFEMLNIYAARVGCEYIEVPLGNKENGWLFPFERFVKSIKTNTRIIYLASPNNPTGAIIPPEQIKYILDSNKDKLIIIDETYSAFWGHSCVNWTKVYNNLVVVRSMSKDYGLAGLRLGYLVSNPENTQYIKRVLSPYSVNQIAVIAGIEALDDDNYLSLLRAEIKKSRSYLTSELQNLGIKVYESEANFILADFGARMDFAYEILKQNRIIVKKFPFLRCIRITIPNLEGSKKIVSLLKPKDVIVFDTDGVLIDVRGAYKNAVLETYKYFAKKNIPVEEFVQARNSGLSDLDLTYCLLKNAGIWVPYDDIVQLFKKLYWNNGQGSINQETLLIDLELLKNLSSKYLLAVYSPRPRMEVEFTFRKFGIMKYFSKIVTKEDMKSEVSGIETIRNTLIAGKILYCSTSSDALKDALTFQATGVGIADTKEKQADLIANGAKYIINDVNKLSDLIQ